MQLVAIWELQQPAVSSRQGCRMNMPWSCGFWHGSVLASCTPARPGPLASSGSHLDLQLRISCPPLPSNDHEHARPLPRAHSAIMHQAYASDLIHSFIRLLVLESQGFTS